VLGVEGEALMQLSAIFQATAVPEVTAVPEELGQEPGNRD
jgi:hypothetical protein